jgi:hypothetical protein
VQNLHIESAYFINFQNTKRKFSGFIRSRSNKSVELVLFIKLDLFVWH